MTTLDSSFETDLQEAILDTAERELIGQRAPLAFQFVELVHSRLRSYGERYGYDVQPAIDSLGPLEVNRTGDGISVTIGWADEQMARWEFGVSPHTIDGDPVLSFVWEDPPAEVREQFRQARDESGRFTSGVRVFFASIDHPGIPASRAIRDSLRGYEEVVRNG
jgi:hypothetical protein